MRNRLVMGAFRYGLFRAQLQEGIRYDSLSSIQRHLEAYRESGNLEHLVDIANLCLVEFTVPAHPTAHFSPIDDGDHHAECI